MYSQIMEPLTISTSTVVTRLFIISELNYYKNIKLKLQVLGQYYKYQSHMAINCLSWEGTR